MWLLLAVMSLAFACSWLVPSPYDHSYQPVCSSPAFFCLNPVLLWSLPSAVHPHRRHVVAMWSPRGRHVRVSHPLHRRVVLPSSLHTMAP